MILICYISLNSGASMQRGDAARPRAMLGNAEHVNGKTPGDSDHKPGSVGDAVRTEAMYIANVYR